MGTLGVVVGFIPFGLLFWVGLTHARRFGEFRSLLHAQGVLAGGHVRPIAIGVVLAEIVVGLAGLLLVAGIGGTDAIWVWTHLTATVLFMGFGAYIAVLVRTRSSAPCGCGDSETPANAWTFARALIAASVSASGIYRVPIEFASIAVGEILILMLAVAAMVILLMLLPDAMATNSSKVHT